VHMRGEGSIATVKIVCLLDVDVRGLCLVAFEAPRCPRGERPRHTGNSGFIAIHGSCVWLYGEGALTPHKATRDARALPEARADGSLLRLVVEGSTGAPPFAPPARCLFLVPTLHVPCLKTRHRITVGATGLVVNLRRPEHQFTRRCFAPPHPLAEILHAHRASHLLHIGVTAPCEPLHAPLMRSATVLRVCRPRTVEYSELFKAGQ
jgi:hypothetical protein